MKKLKEILYKVSIEGISGSTAIDVGNISIDSRDVMKDDMYVAITGTQLDGHQFIGQAIASGAKSILCETLPENLEAAVVYIQVKDTRSALGWVAANFYDNPSSQLELIGVTGTNGKTSIATLLFDLFTLDSTSAGLISTMAIQYGENRITATHTTPDPLTINKHLREMVDHGVEYCFMEVSSHGIDQKRIAGLVFKGAVFTNLTHDHLDYHPTFKAYRDTKKILFDSLHETAFALINADDKNAKVMVQNCKAKIHTYALHRFAEFSAQVLESQFKGMLLKINQKEIWTQMLGEFNAYNILAVYAVSQLLGKDEWESLKSISQLKSVAGRFQTFETPNKVMVVVDYAHTPDALKNVLMTINKIRTQNESLITVVGCGGNRDQEKRPMMGFIAAQLSSKVLFTSDNPRDEDPDRIIKQMTEGVDPVDYKKTMSVSHRKEAIKVAYQLSQPGDVVLIAGKGHENYQEVKGQRLPFDDYEIAQEIFSKTP
ncbi:MAG: UDP-N-acetylmuramoyl-L-alanyl-D-glutamate--2,6-diaminopimelate ligase [Flavobacteriaceae bacterium]|nr:UDP-N-acetylmuramoyl-L-alanyl-D-glutamate--2,6-diaminopimelate ligase [Flavobacteriaceae bacterium]